MPRYTIVESRERTIVKTITWRLIAIVVTYLITYAIYGNYEVSFFTAVLINLVKSILYYLHERAWTKIKWGYKLRVRK